LREKKILNVGAPFYDIKSFDLYLRLLVLKSVAATHTRKSVTREINSYYTEMVRINNKEHEKESRSGLLEASVMWECILSSYTVEILLGNLLHNYISLSISFGGLILNYVCVKCVLSRFKWWCDVNDAIIVKGLNLTRTSHACTLRQNRRLTVKNSCHVTHMNQAVINFSM
jgi:hypothetical protein